MPVNIHQSSPTFVRAQRLYNVNFRCLWIISKKKNIFSIEQRQPGASTILSFLKTKTSSSGSCGNIGLNDHSFIKLQARVRRKTLFLALILMKQEMFSERSMRVADAPTYGCLIKTITTRERILSPFLLTSCSVAKSTLYTQHSLTTN